MERVAQFEGIFRHLTEILVFGARLLHWIREVVFAAETRYNTFS